MNILQTERLLIRNFTKADGPDLFEYLSLPEIYRFEPGDPVNQEQANQIAAERAGGDDFLAVILKSNNKMIGHLYFSRTQPVTFLTWELGYIFNPAFHNRGYCTEASKRILEYGFNNLHAHRIEAFCNPLNLASCKVLEKIGMKREGYFRKKGFFRRDDAHNPLWHDCIAYGIIEEDVDSITALST